MTTPFPVIARPSQVTNPGRVFAALALSIVVASCASYSGETIARARYLMGTECRITGPVEGLSPKEIDAAFEEIARVEQMLSTWREDSELSALNRSAEGSATPVSGELAWVLSESMKLASETGGAFNPLIAPLVELWKLREEGAVPGDDEIRAAVDRMRLELVTIDLERSTATRSGGARFEEGAFGKGYALDRAERALRDAGAFTAVIDFGGQVLLYGFGEPIEVTIASPEDRQQPIMSVFVSEGSVSTSSGSERTFEIDGARYSHLLDPRTGRALPPRGSVTVVHRSAMTADILSTALYVLGPEEGKAWADQHEVAAIFLVPSNERYKVIVSNAVKFNVKVDDEWFEN